MKNNRFQCSIAALLYILTIHVTALVFFGVFRMVLFLCTDYEFPESISQDWGLQAVAFVNIYSSAAMEHWNLLFFIAVHLK